MGRGPFGYLPSADEGAFDRLCANLDPEWVEAALEATGTATVRKRRLPAEQVIWLVLGMALYRHRPIAELVERLDLALPVLAFTRKRGNLDRDGGRGPPVRRPGRPVQRFAFVLRAAALSSAALRR